MLKQHSPCYLDVGWKGHLPYQESVLDNMCFGSRHRRGPLCLSQIMSFNRQLKLKSLFSPDQTVAKTNKKIVGLDFSWVKPVSWCLKVSFTITCTGCKEKSQSALFTREIRQYLNHKIYFLSATMDSVKYRDFSFISCHSVKDWQPVKIKDIYIFV